MDGEVDGMAEAATVALRERGVYLLPDGRRVVACEVNERGGWGLYTEAEWESETAADYEAGPDGEVRFQGERTGWTTRDLRDTGETA